MKIEHRYSLITLTLFTMFFVLFTVETRSQSISSGVLYGYLGVLMFVGIAVLCEVDMKLERERKAAEKKVK